MNKRARNALLTLTPLALAGALVYTAQPAGAQGQLGDPKQAALTAAGNTKGGKVSVLAVWGGSEQEAFLEIVKPFEDATGIKVEYEGTRDINAVLTTRIQGGNPPDVAGLPSLGAVETFAKENKLVALDGVLDMNAVRRDFGAGWLELGSYNNKLYGFFITADVKGLIWYNTKRYDGPKQPQTWNELMTWAKRTAASGKTPWCVGVESGAASGWPGTDWIENIFLRQSGPQKYDQWYNGKLAWTSPEVKSAFQAFGEVVTDPKMVFGGPTAVLTTNFGDAGNPMFSNPPSCFLHHQASFIADFFTKGNPGVKPVDDFDFFGFPNINAQFAGSIEAAGDMFGLYKDTPQSRALVRYLSTAEAQSIWVKRGPKLSPNKRVPASLYPNALSRRSAQIIANARAVRFDASDLMPAAMNQAFWKAILEYVQNPSKLDAILQNLDKVRAEAYK
jgi:alpha-glucoside transport system substrate-binding protein